MNISHSLIIPCLLSVGVLSAASGWVPTFNDKPVAASSVAKVEQALPSEPIVKPAAKRRILVVSSTAGFRHRSIPIGKIAIEKLGEATGAYEATISDDPANFEPDVLKTFDTVLLLNTTQDFFMPSKNQRKQYTAAELAELQKQHNRLIDNLINYVEQGGGLVGIHAATDTCYQHKEYGEAIGAYFNGHPWRAKDQVTIVVEDQEHALNRPVFGAQKDFELVEEIYQFKEEPYSRERLRILLHLDPERSAPVKGLKRTDNDYAVAWVQSVGKGRVFYTSIGHNDHIYQNPLMLTHYLAGIQFACGDLKADTTPSAKISIPNVAACCGHDEEWTSLFDGKTLNGWTQQNGTATYEVREGVIVGRSVLGSPNSFLCTDKTYGDFELEFEVKCGAINSGVQIRSLQDDAIAKGHVQGPQVEIEHSPGQSGYIYGEAYSSSWRSPEPKSKDPKVNAHRIFKNDEWNHYRVRAKGPVIQTWINGQAVADLNDPESYEQFPRGMIGLQVHSHTVADVEIEWRNLRIREIK
jgi:type 1 glutamine amidotransferase